jgi:hypothetical protein
MPRKAGAITGDDLFAHIARQLQHAKQEPMRMGQGRSIEIVRYGTATVEAQISEENPYQGLNAFTPATQRFFFGREAEIATLIEKLAQSNFVPVVGPSGIGKSSVVRAGLWPQAQNFGWPVIVMKPDDEPMPRLRLAIKDWLETQPISAAQRQKLCTIFDRQGLPELVKHLPGKETLLLVVDQFEEVFTLRKQTADESQQRHVAEETPQPLADEQAQFLQQLIAVGAQPQSRLKIVTTLRSDFIDPWLSTGQPPSVVQEQTVYLGPLQGQNLQDAIVKPAERQGYRFGEGLLTLILKDVAEEPNSLPLLEFALTELWERRDTTNHVLSAAAYTAMGGLKGALDRRAEAEYSKLPAPEQAWAKKICLELVRLGRDEKDTRRRRAQADILDLAKDDLDRETIEYVIRDFVEGRLLVTNGNAVGTGLVPAPSESTT